MRQKTLLAYALRSLLMASTSLWCTTLAAAESEYVYIESSLGFPWFMFFVFLALVAIPFLLIIFLSAKKRKTADGETPSTADPHRTEPGIKRFNRIILPLILVVIGIVTWFLVLNAFQANELMEQNGRATPTLLNPGVH